ncbi:hypothetical protein [Sneathiella limimaris]|uniref:hypothetical protein n=1 Tax=Sneathiella limimaris TaxID=1964213 RepID=UPI00146BAA7D|nr:hypothetical protein [Sneathiella limimaris]
MSETEINLQVKEQEEYLAEPRNGFFINKKTAAAHFLFPLDIHGGINGLKPLLSLEYRSDGGLADSVSLPKGWRIRGLQCLEKLASGDVMLDGQMRNATVVGKSSLKVKDKSGHSQFFKRIHSRKSGQYQLKRTEDNWQNRIQYFYSASGFIRRITYGREGFEPWETIRFKRAFFVGEIFLGLMMAQPNIFWGLLPAIIPGGFWDYFYMPRAQVDGADIPWFAEAAPVAPNSEDSAPSIVIELEEAEEGPEEEASRNEPFEEEEQD